MRSHVRATLAALMLAGGLAGSATVANAAPPLFIHLLGLKLAALIGGNAKVTEWLSTHAYVHARRVGTCEERRAEIVALLPDAVRLGHLALDVYNTDPKANIAKAGLTDLGGGRAAVYDPQGERYAEVRDLGATIAVAFRGTRFSYGGDVAADLLNFAGITTDYYRWASSVVQRVMKDHPGRKVAVTGHSLGGGLALYAVLHNPGAEAFVFNPAGLSWASWFGASHADRVRMKQVTTVIATRHGTIIEPVSSVSFAHRMVLPGRWLVVDSPASGSRELHSQAKLVALLEKLEVSEAKGEACEGYIAAAVR